MPHSEKERKPNPAHGPPNHPARSSVCFAAQRLDVHLFRTGALWYALRVRHESLPPARGRPVTPRRLQAAARALQREQDEHPLFAAEIAAEQPTPEERVAELDAEHIAHWQQIRDHTARTWRAARRVLHSLPAEKQQEFIDKWNAAPCPASAAYFADFIWRTVTRG